MWKFNGYQNPPIEEFSKFKFEINDEFLRQRDDKFVFSCILVLDGGIIAGEALRNKGYVSVYHTRTGVCLKRSKEFFRVLEFQSIPQFFGLDILCRTRFDQKDCMLQLSDMKFKDVPEVVKDVSEIVVLEKGLMMFETTIGEDIYRLDLYDVEKKTIKELDQYNGKNGEITSYATLPNQHRFVAGGHIEKKERTFIRIYDWVEMKLICEKFLFVNRRSIHQIIGRQITKTKHKVIPVLFEGGYARRQRKEIVGSHCEDIPLQKFLTTYLTNEGETSLIAGVGNGIHVLDTNGKKKRKKIKPWNLYSELEDVDGSYRKSMCSFLYVYGDVFIVMRKNKRFANGSSLFLVNMKNGNVQGILSNLLESNDPPIWLSKGEKGVYSFILFGRNKRLGSNKMYKISLLGVPKPKEEETEGEEES